MKEVLVRDRCITVRKKKMDGKIMVKDLSK